MSSVCADPGPTTVPLREPHPLVCMPSLLLPRFLLSEMSDKKSPPRKEKAYIVRSLPPDDKGMTMKRKLLKPGSPTAHDEDEKRTPSKRKRGSVSLESSPLQGHLSTPKTPGGGSRSVPLSERQQLAMIMRMSDESNQGAIRNTEPEPPVKPPSPPVIQPLKKTPLDKKVHKRNERGELPIHLAAIRGDVKYLKRLIKAGADVNVADFAGWTPLHEASNRGWLYVAKQLLKAGANVNVQGLENDTPLHDASINGHRKVVQLLLKHGANPLQPNSKGKTPLDVAASDEMVSLLKREVMSSASDSSSLDDPPSPDSISSLKDDDRSLDTEDLSRNRSESFSSTSSLNNRKIVMPKSPEGKMASPRLCLKFQRDHLGPISQKSRDSHEPQYKTYSVTNVSSMDLSLDNPMFSPVNSPSSSIDSDIYNPGLDSVSNFSGSVLKKFSISEPNNCSAFPALHQQQQQLNLTVSSYDQNHFCAPSQNSHSHTHALELAVNQVIKEAEDHSGPRNNDLNSHSFLLGNSTSTPNVPVSTTGDQHSNPLRHMDTQQFTPHLNWSESMASNLENRESSIGSMSSNRFSQDISKTEPSDETLSQSPPLNIPQADKAAALPNLYNHVMEKTNSHGDYNSCVSSSTCGSRQSASAPFQSTVTSTTGSNNCVLPTNGVSSDENCRSVAREENNSAAASASSSRTDTPCQSSDNGRLQVGTSNNSTSPVSNSNTWGDMCSASSPVSESGNCNTSSCSTSSQSTHKTDISPCVSSGSRASSPSRLPEPVKESKSECRESRPSSPKVPPLKIIIPTKSQATSSSDPSSDRLKLVVTNVKSAHPYVINPYHSQNGDQPPNSEELTLASTCTSTSVSSLLANSNPQSENGSPSSTEAENVQVSVCDKVSSDRSDKNENAEVSSLKNGDKCSVDNSEDVKCDSDSGSSRTEERRDEPPQRVLRSAVRSQQNSEPRQSKQQQQQQKQPEKTLERNASIETPTCNAAESVPAPVTSQRSSSKDDEYMNIHPRKRKIRPRADTTGSNTPTRDSPSPGLPSCFNERVNNPYEMYIALRKKIASRRQGYLGMVNICPKTPQGFKDYLMKTCNYVLQGNATSTLSVPTLSPPNSVKDKMRDLFQQQEEVRYKLRLQHLIEREKLILSIEQEILREHARAARAVASQGTPLSACTILRDEEIYNITDTDPEEKDKKNRTRYNGRQFLSWIQDVDDKYEKIKELLILRQKQEADSLFAIQKLEWEWRLKDLGQCDRNTVPDIDELHVPLVQVTDNFDLLPT